MDAQVTSAKEQKKKNSLFVLACARGYLDDVKELLDRGADLAAVDKRRVSGLHFACGQGRLEVVKFLWTRGFELDAEDPEGNLPLHYAIFGSKTAIVDFLLEKGAWVEGSNSLDDTPLHTASRKGQLEIVKALLNHGGKACLKDINKRGLTALGEAVVGGQVAIAEELVKAGAGLGAKGRGWSLLHLAASAGGGATVKFLLNRGLKVDDASNGEGNTPLHCAAAAGSLQAAKLLVASGSDLTIGNSHGRQPQDLVPTAAKDLKKLLRTSTNVKQPKSGALAAATAPANDRDEFKALSDSQRRVRVEKWAALEDSEQLSKALLEFPRELQNQVQELRKLQQILNIQKANVDLLDDDDFQELAAAPKAREAVERVNASQEAFRQYAEDDEVMSLLRSLQRFQAVVRANGGHKVPFQALLRSCEAGHQEKSRMRLKGMQLMLDARYRAAVAAGLAETEEEAKSRAAEEMDPRRPGPGAAARAANVDKPQQVSQVPRSEESKPAASPRAQEGQQESHPSTSGERESFEDVAIGRKPFTWQALWKEMVRSLGKTIAMFLVFVAFTYFTTGQLPWEAATPAQPEIRAPADSSAAYEL